MPGYPNKISRLSLGPTYQNAAKVGKPQEEADAAIFNLMCWQVAGMNAVAPRAVIIGQADSVSIAIVKQFLSWDPNGALGPTTFARSGVGAYTWALPLSGLYNDMNANPVQFIADYAMASCHAVTSRNMTAEIDTGGWSGTMNCWLAGAAAEIGTGVGTFRKFMLVLI